MDRLKLALVGAGRMGQRHAEAIRTSGRAVLAAVVDPRPDSALRVARDHGLVFDSVDDLLRTGGFDATVVAAPTSTHAQILSELLERGVPVLCEKPCGLSSEGARLIADLAQVAGTPVRVGYWRRHVESLRRLRERVVTGELGEVITLHCTQWDEQPPPASFRDPAVSGGIALDMAVHEIDMILWLTGQEIVEVRGMAAGACFEPPVPGDPETAEWLLALSQGSTAFVSCVRRHRPGDLCRVELLAAQGAVSCTFLDPSLGEQQWTEYLGNQIDDFVELLHSGRDRCATIADAVAALEAAERLRHALHSGPVGVD